MFVYLVLVILVRQLKLKSLTKTKILVRQLKREMLSRQLD